MADRLLRRGGVKAMSLNDQRKLHNNFGEPATYSKDEKTIRLDVRESHQPLELVEAYKFTNLDGSTVIYVECPQNPDYYIRVFSDHYHQTVNVEWMNTIPREVKHKFKTVAENDQ